MQNRTVAIVWAVGLCLAALVYAAGPDDAMAALFNLVNTAADTLQRAVLDLGGRAFDMLRALAIGCFAVFFVLSVIATGRGQPGRWLMLVVSLLFLLLVWHQGPEATGHWALAFLLSVSAALNVTRKLGQAPGHLVRGGPGG